MGKVVIFSLPSMDIQLRTVLECAVILVCDVISEGTRIMMRNPSESRSLSLAETVSLTHDQVSTTLVSSKKRDPVVLTKRR